MGPCGCTGVVSLVACVCACGLMCARSLLMSVDSSEKFARGAGNKSSDEARIANGTGWAARLPAVYVKSRASAPQVRTCVETPEKAGRARPDRHLHVH